MLALRNETQNRFELRKLEQNLCVGHWMATADNPNLYNRRMQAASSGIPDHL